MGAWPSSKAGRVLSALLRIGWVIERHRGSHRRLRHAERGPYTFAFHDDEEIRPAMLAKIAKATGLTPEDL